MTTFSIRLFPVCHLRIGTRRCPIKLNINSSSNAETIEICRWTVSVVYGTTANVAGATIRNFCIRPSLSNRIGTSDSNSNRISKLRRSLLSVSVNLLQATIFDRYSLDSICSMASFFTIMFMVKLWLFFLSNKMFICSVVCSFVLYSFIFPFNYSLLATTTTTTFFI